MTNPLVMPECYDAYKLAGPPDDEPSRPWTPADDKRLAEKIAETKRLMGQPSIDHMPDN